jgi:hypothetical protein
VCYVLILLCRLFGVVCRVAEPERVKYVCHVIQADQSGSKVAGAISEAIQKLWRMVQVQCTMS